LTSLDSMVQKSRIIHLAISVSVPFYAFVGEWAGPPPGEIGVLYKVLVAAAVADLGLFAFFRITMLRSAEETLATRPDDATALGRWFRMNVVTFVLCETVALLGLVIRFLGGDLLQAGPFYGVAFLLLLVFSPRRP
jgi:hypothetical protein